MPLSRRTLLTLLAAAPLAASPLAAQGNPKVVTTTGMIADAARKIGDIEVRALLGPGLDPHAYRQTRSDIAALARADLVLWHGLYLETQMEGFLLDLAARTRVVAVADALPRDLLRADPGYPDRFDPHVWMDPALWARVTETIQSALDALDPAAAERHAAAAGAYRAGIAALDAYARSILATVPADRRVLVTAHDAFGYFGQAYGFEVLGIQGISTESEAGLARIGALVDLLVSRGIGAVFVESSVSDRSVRALIEGAAARGHAVSIGGELFSDAMGPEGSYEGTYIGMIDHNVTTIARGLAAGAGVGHVGAPGGSRMIPQARITASTALAPPPLSVQGLSVAYGETLVVDSVDATFPAGSMTAIVGPNGAGKSTFLKAALGLVPPVAGRAEFFGAPLAVTRDRVAYVPQRAGVDWDFPARVIDVVEMGLYRQTGLFGRMRRGHYARAVDCIARVGLADFAGRQIGALSGGQQQRVFLARALAQGADLYLLDEPFAGVDAATEKVLVGLLQGLRDAGAAVVAVHHDLATVPAYFDRVLLLNRRTVAEGPVAGAFTQANIACAYGTPLAADA